MQIKDLEIFNQMPFSFWIKDETGKYVWCNRAVSQLAKGEVIGKTDRELIWADNADEFQADDKQVFETGKPIYRHEHMDESSQGKVTHSVCKWLGELDGKKQCFGIAFFIEKGEETKPEQVRGQSR